MRQQVLQIYASEVQFALIVLNEHLRKSNYIAGGQHSIADICLYGSLLQIRRLGIELVGYTGVLQWLASLEMLAPYQAAHERVFAQKLT